MSYNGTKCRVAIYDFFFYPSPGPPDTPSALQMVNVSFDEVTLQWVEEFNGGHSNTEFVISYASPHNGKSEIYECRRSNPCIVTGLTPQTLYTFSVKAANPAGESEYSDFVSVHTKGLYFCPVQYII